MIKIIKRSYPGFRPYSLVPHHICSHVADDESGAAANEPVQGSFLNLLPPKLEVSQKHGDPHRPH